MLLIISMNVLTAMSLAKKVVVGKIIKSELNHDVGINDYYCNWITIRR